MSIYTEDGQYEPLDKFVPATIYGGDALSVPETILHGAVATIVDIGSTYWNSLTPEKYNVETVDLLSRIDQDALNVYNEHTDAIQAASFIGGLVAPVGLSIKGMNMLRSGAKGFSWFSEAGQATKLVKAEEAFARAGRDADFIKSKWDLYRNVAYNAVADNVAAEVAIMASLSAHPYMEDYYKDFGSNFLKSVAFGTGIQTGLGVILKKTDLAKLTSKMEFEANDLTKAAMWDAAKKANINARSHLGEELAARLQGLDNLKAIVAEADTANSWNLRPFVVETLRNNVVREEAAMFTKLKEASSGELTKFLDDAPKEITERYLAFVARSENAGLDKIGFAPVVGETPDKFIGKLQQGPTLMKTITKVVKDALGVESASQQIVKSDAIYLSQYDRYISKSDGPLYMNMSDLGKSIEQLEKGIDKNLGRYPNSDWSVELRGMHTAVADSNYAEAILAVEKWETKDFEKAVIDPDHLPMLKAIYARAAKLSTIDPEFKLKIKVTKEAPSWDVTKQVAINQRGGLSPTYVKDLKQIEARLDEFSNYHPDRGSSGDITNSAARLLDRWIGGDMADTRTAALSYRNILHGNSLSSDYYYRTIAPLVNTLDEIYHSSRSKAFRAELQKLADPDGNVWVYRGMHADKPTSHKGLESYTLLGEKAAEFGSVKMYKVHIDDILTVIHDIGGNKRMSEILVLPPTRDFAAVDDFKWDQLPEALEIKAPEIATIGVGKSAVVENVDQLETTLRTSLLNSINELKRIGYGIETIALKTGTPEETVARILEDGYVSGAGMLRYTSVEDVVKALDVNNRSLALSTNMHKVPQPELYAELNKKNLDNSSQGILEYFLLSSKSKFVRDFGEVLLSADMKMAAKSLYDELPSITQSKLKNTMFASTNQALEAMGPVGMIANYIGKETIRIKNQITETLEKPVSSLMAAIIKKGEAELIEANTSIAVNASISGPRMYKSGAFWIPTEAAPPGIVKQAINWTADEFEAFKELYPEAFKKASYQGKEYSIMTPEVQQMWETLQTYGREMYELKNTKMKALGREGLSDIGLWVPSTNFKGKSTAYVHNLVDNTTSMLYADTDELLATAIKNYEDALINKYGKNWRAYERIVPKSMQEEYNSLAGRHDDMLMQAADLSKRHGGASTPTLVATDTSVFQDLLQSYRNHVHNGIEDIMEITMNDTMNALKDISEASKGLYAPETKTVMQKLADRPVDPGQTVRNILLGRPTLSEHKAWSELQQRAQVGTDMVLKSISEVFQPLLAPVVGKLSKTTVRTEESWKQVLASMEEKGIHNPFDALDKEFGLGRYLVEGKGKTEGLTPRAVALGNATAATLLLRVMELAQPLVNALSLPILTSAAVGRKLEKSFLGAAIDPKAKFSVTSAMYDGIRLMNHPTESFKWSKLAEERGIFSMELRNVTELLEHQRSLDPGLMAATEKGLESSLVRLLSKPADISESFVRRAAFFTGVNMAKKAYPGLGDVGVMAFARNFMDEAIGNYTAAQRPAMFQGTFGVAMGLFQTYMLTMAQAMYRQVQYRDWKALGKMLLTQSTIFGASSLPGFHQVSEAIGSNFSDNHIDLETGTFRAIDDDVANIVLYGLPSSFGPGIVTRGDLQPRLPNPFQLNNLATVNIAQQAYTSMERIASAAWNADESAGKAILEAISLQSISRPIARISELAIGRSITSRGDIVADDLRPDSVDNLFSLSTLSRIMSARPLEEIKAREALHLNTLYNAADSEKRRGVTARLKSHIRNGDLDQETLENLAEQYMRTGSSTGWRAAVADAIKQAAQGGDATTLNKLKKDSPLQMMIDDTE